MKNFQKKEKKTRLVKFILSLLITMVFFTNSSGASVKNKQEKCTNGGALIQNYYVAPNGDDSLNDGSKNCPFKTIKYGVSLLKASNKLIIRSGNYREKNIKISHSGTPAHPITIMAETAGSVFISGDRPTGIIRHDVNHGDGFQIHNVTNIIIDGIHFNNFSIGIKISGRSFGLSKNITVKNSIFLNNSAVGIQNWKSDNLYVFNCRFLSLIPVGGWADPNNPNAIQDYGVSIYHSTGAIIEQSYFYGAHNQALSFKYGCHDGIARKNIFAGNLYTAIYFGQGEQSDKRPTSTNLLAEYNIIRSSKNYRMKNPITIRNAKDSTIRYNYIDGHGLAHNRTGITVFNEAHGLIKIYKNIVAFSANKTYLDFISSVGVYLHGISPNNSEITLFNEVHGLIKVDDNNLIYLTPNLPKKTQIKIYNNTFYDLYYEFYENFSNTYSFNDNIVWNCENYWFTEPSTKPNFINGDPIAPPTDSEPTYHNFDSYYKQLTNPFRLNNNDNIN
jgi:hypothetical protein